MEWLRNRPILNKQPRALLYEEQDCDPQACYDSFKEHWQQALKIIQRVQVRLLKSLKTIISYI